MGWPGVCPKINYNSQDSCAGASGSCSSFYSLDPPLCGPDPQTSFGAFAWQSRPWAPAWSFPGNFSCFVTFLFPAVIFLSFFLFPHCYARPKTTPQRSVNTEVDPGIKYQPGRSDPGSESGSLSVGMNRSGLQKVPTSVREAKVFSSLF